MTIKEHISQSLIPYLDSVKSNVFLKIPLRSEDPAVLEKISDPFLKVTDAGIFSRIIEAQFVTNAGGRIKRVFLFLQKDKYLFANDDLRPVNNLDIDQLWQNAFLFYSGKDQSDSAIILSDRKNEEGRALPFRSLFFCKLKQSFFHPPCPKCGSHLQECRDDNLLVEHGLHPYSTSKKRYLYCPACLDSETGSDFYALSSDGFDPPLLKSCSDLIRGFGAVTEETDPSSPFPCVGCYDRGECYGPDGPAESRIVPFSFYPFYLLIFEAMSVNAVDFLPLISGASFEDLETSLAEKQELGRINCLKELREKSIQRTPFLFDRNDRFFLEVLYLKLSFLGDLIRTVPPEFFAQRGPDPGFSIDQLWVKLSDQGGLLPFFWDFKVRLMDIGHNSPVTHSLLKVPLSYGLYYLGIVWFYTFLVNRGQDVSSMYDALGQAIEGSDSSDENDLENIFKNTEKPAFSHANIFWNPEDFRERPFNEDWKNLWDGALGLGWSLLKSGIRGNSEWSSEDFFQKLDDLRSDIKDNLFREKTSDVPVDFEQEDKSIVDILNRIMGKWSSELKEKEEVPDTDVTVVLPTSPGGVPEPLPPPVDVVTNDGDVQQTVVLSYDDFEGKTLDHAREEDSLIENIDTLLSSDEDHGFSDALEKAPTYPVGESSGLDKTVIMTPSSDVDSGSSDESLEATSSPTSEDGGLDETVTMSPFSNVVPGSSDESGQAMSSPISDAGGLDETVILPVGGFKNAVQGSSVSKNDDFPETVILDPSSLGNPLPSSPPPQSSDGNFEHSAREAKKDENESGEGDGLDETVILHPENFRQKE